MSNMSRWALVLALLLPACTQAALVTYQLENVTFDDGGTATGFFILDPTINFDLTSFQVVTTPGTKFPGFQYTPASTTGANYSLPNPGDPSVLNFFTSFTGGIAGPFELAFDGPLPTSVGLFTPIDTALSVEARDRLPARFPTGGVRVVPEPTSFAFLGIGLGLLVVLSKLRCVVPSR